MSEDKIKVLSQRLSAIENDDFVSANKLYNHTRHIFYVAAFLIATVFSLITLVQVTSISQFNDDVDRLIVEARSEISQIAGKSHFKGYLVNFEKINKNLIMYASLKLKGNQVELEFAAPLEIFGLDEGYGHFKGFTVNILENIFLDFSIENMSSDYHKKRLKRNSSILTNEHSDAFINKNTGVTIGLSLNYNFPIKECLNVIRFINKIANDENRHGIIEIIPVILNKKGIVEKTTIPFTLLFSNQTIVCPNN